MWLGWWAAVIASDVVPGPVQNLCRLDTVTCLPRTIVVNVLSVWAMTLCGTLYGGSKARRRASCLINAWVESFTSLLMNVEVYEWRTVGVGRSWSMRRRSCCMKVDGSMVGTDGARGSP